MKADRISQRAAIPCFSADPTDLEDVRFLAVEGKTHRTMFDAVKASFSNRCAGSFALYCQKFVSSCTRDCDRSKRSRRHCFNIAMCALQKYDPARSGDPFTITRKLIEEDRGF